MNEPINMDPSLMMPGGRRLPTRAEKRDNLEATLINVTANLDSILLGKGITAPLERLSELTLSFMERIKGTEGDFESVPRRKMRNACAMQLLQAQLEALEQEADLTEETVKGIINDSFERADAIMARSHSDAESNVDQLY